MQLKHFLLIMVRFTSLLVIIFAAAATLQVASAKVEDYHYDGLILTSIDVKKAPIEGHPNRVTFSEATPGKKDDTTAVLLHKIKCLKDGGKGKKEFEAEELTPRNAQQLINNESTDEKERKSSFFRPKNRKALFCVHGFNVQPSDQMQNLKTTEQQFKKFALIPVIWPSKGGALNYWTDRVSSAAAGRAFQSLSDSAKHFKNKSLLCHSLGNRVLRNFAMKRFKFDNIFMVAADVERQLFHDNYINGSSGPEDEREDGLDIFSMLSKEGGKIKGKIHVLHNRFDYALTGSAITKFGLTNRLGFYGVNFGDKWFAGGKVHPKFRTPSRGIANFSKLSFGLQHSYQFKKECIDYYEQQYVNEDPN